MPRQVSKSVVVVGAGLAGLTCAIYLQRSGVEVTVLEASDRVGGRVKTDSVNGFRFDHGFQVINPNYSEIKRLDALSGIEFNEAFSNLRIIEGDKNLKVGLGHILNTLGVGSISEKINFAKFLFGNPSGRNLGECASTFHEIYSRVLSPFLRGVFLTNPDLIRADISKEVIRSFILGRPGIPSQGVGALAEALSDQVSSLNLSARVDEVKQGSVRGNFGAINCDSVVVATDLTTAAQILDLGAIPKTLSSTTWYHSTSEDLIAGDYLVLDPKSPLVNSLVISKVARSYAPIGINLISSTTIAPISESEVRKELSKIWQCETRNWDLAARYEIKQSLPFRSDLLVLDQNPEIGNGIYVAGDHRSVPSQNGAMRSGRKVAQAII
ncbi:MAG: FAD-dependent oxidoreductase [Actinomycetales bacterium]|nr:MAG: FAD-dependent oxidoreductase [Actinomycetales bacterium]